MALPYTEIGIALSVIVLGLAVAFRISLPTLAAMALVGAVRNLPRPCAWRRDAADLSGYAYAAGFLLATALLHGAGIALGIIGAKSRWRIAQAAGGAMALAGVVLLGSAI